MDNSLISQFSHLIVVRPQTGLQSIEYANEPRIKRFQLENNECLLLAVSRVSRKGDVPSEFTDASESVSSRSVPMHTGIGSLQIKYQCLWLCFKLVEGIGKCGITWQTGSRVLNWSVCRHQTMCVIIVACLPVSQSFLMFLSLILCYQSTQLTRYPPSFFVNIASGRVGYYCSSHAAL